MCVRFLASTTLLLTLFVPCIVTTSAIAGEGWLPIGPYGANVLCLAQDPNTYGRVYAGTRYAGVFVSDDNGRSWVVRSKRLPTEAATGAYRGVYGLTVDPVDGRVYALGAGGIYVSDDAGMEWSMLGDSPGGAGNFLRLYIDPDDHQKLTAANYSGVFVYDFVGTDSERSWSTPPGISVNPILDLERAAADPDVFYAVAGYRLKLFRSGDRVGSWSAVGTLPGTKFRDLAVDASDPARLHVSLDTGCFVSTDGGMNWVRMDDPGDAATVSHFVVFDQSVIAVGRGELYDNRLDPNRLVPAVDFYHTRAAGSVVLPNGSFLLATEMGVFEGTSSSMTAGNPPTLRNNGMNGADVTTVAPALNSSVVYAVTGLSYDAGVFRSDDDGNSWEPRSMGITNPDIRSIAVFDGDPDIVYVGTADAINDTGENGSIYKTTDGGRHWTNVSDALPHSDARIIIALVVHRSDPDIVYASVQGYNGGIFKTVDGGQEWVRYSEGLQSMPPMPGYEDNPFVNYFAMLSLATDPTDPETMFIGAGGCWGGTYRTRNGAEAWDRRSTGYMEMDSHVMMPMVFPVHLELFDIDVDPANPDHLYTCGARGGFSAGDQFGVLWESKNGGETWRIVRQSTRSDYFESPLTGLAMHAGRPGFVYVASRAGVHMSEDGGGSWWKINAGLVGNQQFTRDIVFDPDHTHRLYLATAFAGVFVRELPPTAVRLTHLEARTTDTGTVEITWGVTDAVNHMGFHVDREVDGELKRISQTLVRGADEYRFEDVAPVRGAVNKYWVVELDRLGQEAKFGPVEVVPPGTVSARFRLGTPIPNPLRAGTELQLTIADLQSSVTVRVFDTQGRLVTTLVDGELSGSPYPVRWDGTNLQGQRVENGIYFIQAVSGRESRVQRVVLLP